MSEELKTINIDGKDYKVVEWLGKGMDGKPNSVVIERGGGTQYAERYQYGWKLIGVPQMPLPPKLPFGLPDPGEVFEVLDELTVPEEGWMVWDGTVWVMEEAEGGSDLKFICARLIEREEKKEDKSPIKSLPFGLPDPGEVFEVLDELTVPEEGWMVWKYCEWETIHRSTSMSTDSSIGKYICARLIEREEEELIGEEWALKNLVNAPMGQLFQYQGELLFTRGQPNGPMIIVSASPKYRAEWDGSKWTEMPICFFSFSDETVEWIHREGKEELIATEQTMEELKVQNAELRAMVIGLQREIKEANRENERLWIESEKLKKEIEEKKESTAEAIRLMLKDRSEVLVLEMEISQLKGEMEIFKRSGLHGSMPRIFEQAIVWTWTRAINEHVDTTPPATIIRQANDLGGIDLFKRLMGTGKKEED